MSDATPTNAPDDERPTVDLSKWATALAADGLEPEEHTLTVSGDDTPLIRMHLAFHPDMDDDAREAVAWRLGRLMTEAL